MLTMITLCNGNTSDFLVSFTFLLIMFSRVSFPDIEHTLVVYRLEFAVKRKTPNIASALGPWGQGCW